MGQYMLNLGIKDQNPSCLERKARNEEGAAWVGCRQQEGRWPRLRVAVLQAERRSEVGGEEGRGSCERVLGEGGERRNQKKEGTEGGEATRRRWSVADGEGRGCKPVIGVVP